MFCDRFRYPSNFGPILLQFLASENLISGGPKCNFMLLLKRKYSHILTLGKDKD